MHARRPKAPKLVIYDNSCNLHAYCLNREPEFFKDTLFVVDKVRCSVRNDGPVQARRTDSPTPLAHPQLHFKTHKACSRAYDIGRYSEYLSWNSQLAEQQVRFGSTCYVVAAVFAHPLRCCPCSAELADCNT